MICDKCGNEMTKLEYGEGCMECGLYAPNIGKLLEEQIEKTLLWSEEQREKYIQEIVGDVERKLRSEDDVFNRK